MRSQYSSASHKVVRAKSAGLPVALTLIGTLLFSLMLVSGCLPEQLPGVPTITPSITLPPEPTATHTPQPSVTPTNISASVEMTPLPESQVITARNAQRLKLFGRFGQGFALDIDASPDGQYLVVTSDKALLLYRAAAMNLVISLDLAERPTAITFSPDSKLLAVGDSAGNVTMISLPGGEQLARRDLGASILTIAFSHDGSMLAASTTGGSAYILSASALTLLQRILLDSHLAPVLSFSADDSRVHAWDDRRSVKTYSAATGQFLNDIYVINTAAGDPPVGAIFSRDGSIAVVDQTRTLRLFDLNKRTTISLIKVTDQPLVDISIASDNSTLTGFDGSLVTTWDVSSGELLERQALEQPVHGLRATASLADSSELILLTDRLELVDLATGRVSELPVSGFAPDMRLRAYASAPGELSLYYINGSRQQLMLGLGNTFSGATLSETDIDHLVFDSAHKLAAFVSHGSTINLFNLEDGSLLTSFTLESPVRALAFDADGETLAYSQEDGSLSLWSPGSQSIQNRVTLNEAVQRMWFINDGQNLLTQSRSGVAFLTLPAFQPIHQLRGLVTGISRDGSLASISQHEPQPLTAVYDLAAGKLTSALPESSLQAAFSADNNLLAIAGSQVSVWSLQDGRKLATLDDGHPSGAQIMFSPDDKFLLTSEWDGKVTVWGVP